MTATLLGMVYTGVDDRVLAERICRACVDGLDVDGAAISLLTASESQVTLWASDATAALLEELQFTLNEGACMQAVASGSPVLVADLQEAVEVARWPMFAAAVMERTDVRALFALPLQWGAVNLGVLDLYRVAPGGLSQTQWRDVRSAADIAALLMLGIRTDPGEDGAGWLDGLVGNRSEVHQATGMVLVQLGISAEQALARLRGRAFAEQRLLIEVARDVVARRLTFNEDEE